LMGILAFAEIPPGNGIESHIRVSHEEDFAPIP
jgi:hypothetical protein